MNIFSLFLAWLIALSGALISLYFGEILGIKPCPLCWYQRIALFPLAILLGMAVYKKDESIIPYGLTLATIGFIVAAYQALSQRFPFLDLEAICGKADDCASPIFTLFGFITMPILSATGFFLIILFLCFAKRKLNQS